MNCTIVIEELYLCFVAIICAVILLVWDSGKEIVYTSEAVVKLPSNANIKLRSLPGMTGSNREREKLKFS